MARCSCGNATCSCIVKAVPKSGITVIGSGSPTRPYLIGMDESTAIGEVIDVVDTPTVNLEKSGTGTPADHFQLSASATVKMTDLLDVNDPTGPQLNEVPVWVGGHWEFKAQSGSGGSVVTQTPIPTAHAAYSRKAALAVPISTPTRVTWDTVETAAVGITFGNDTFTAQIAGTYLVTCSMSFANAVNTGYYQIRIIKNGVLFDYNAAPTDDVVGYQVVVSRQLQLAVGDVIAIELYCNPASAIVVSPTYNTNGVQITLLDVPAGTGVAGINVINGIGGDGSSALPLKALTSGVWGTPPLDIAIFGDLATNSLRGDEVYVDSAGQLRARPQHVVDNTRMAADTADKYPLGLSLLTLGTAQSGAGGWPTGFSSHVMTLRRSDGNANYQWWYRNASLTSQIDIRVRATNGTNTPWTPWLQVVNDSGWVDVAINSGFAMQGTEKPQVRLINGVVYGRGGWNTTGLTSAGSYDVGVIPAGYRPAMTVHAQMGCGLANVNATGLIGTSGVINLRVGSPFGNYYMFGGQSWPAEG